MIRPIKAIVNSSTYTTSAQDSALMVATPAGGTAITGTPNPVGPGVKPNGQELLLRDRDGQCSPSRKITFQANSGQTTETGQPYEITEPYGTLRVICDGTTWRKV